ncbi:MAG TPA: hypothetical protein VF169_13235 [Albitalea sp.]|uniref:hypothetical protein n=1 Tax=Piscinibacter sp. TaxID=1903157 RepID=UPI002ED2324A
MSTRSLLAAVLLAFAALAGAAEDDPQAAARAGLERLKALREARPGDGALVYFEALMHARLGDGPSAVAALRSLVGRRLGIVPVPSIGFEAIADDPDFRAVCEALAAQEAATTPAPLAFRLDDPRLIPEGIAFDPATARFFVGSIAQRKIVVTDGRGRARTFSRASDRLDSVLGLAVDATRRQLYAVSTVLGDAGRDDRRNAVQRYDLARGRLVERIAAPDAMQLNDVAVGPDGTLYASDSAGHALFRRKPGEATLTRVGEAGSLVGANGVAVAPDGIVYVTLFTGIARVDTGSGEMKRLPQPDSVVTGGIDGLYWHDGDLVGVQNSTNPGRVIRIRLADGGTRIDGVTVLQSHHHALFDEPTTGVIARGALHVIANSHVAQRGDDGTLKDVARLRPTSILAVPLRR